MAQTADVQFASDVPQPIAAARCRYTPADGSCAGATDSTPAKHDSVDGLTVAQVPRRMPGPPFRRPGPIAYSHGPYPGPWMAEHSGRHALIGAVIGFGMGIGIGAKGKASAGATVGIGAIGGLLGAAFGSSIPSLPSRNPYRGRWRDQDEEASRAKAVRPGLSRPNTQQMASPSSKEPVRTPEAATPNQPAAAAP
jgi:hypothetical protein